MEYYEDMEIQYSETKEISSVRELQTSNSIEETKEMNAVKELKTANRIEETKEINVVEEQQTSNRQQRENLQQRQQANQPGVTSGAATAPAHTVISQAISMQSISNI